MGPCGTHCLPGHGCSPPRPQLSRAPPPQRTLSTHPWTSFENPSQVTSLCPRLSSALPFARQRCPSPHTGLGFLSEPWPMVCPLLVVPSLLATAVPSRPQTAPPHLRACPLAVASAGMSSLPTSPWLVHSPPFGSFLKCPLLCDNPSPPPLACTFYCSSPSRFFPTPFHIFIVFLPAPLECKFKENWLPTIYIDVLVPQEECLIDSRYSVNLN